MSQPITEIPMATVANHPSTAATYPTLNQMSTDGAIQVPDQTVGQCEHHRQEDVGSSSSFLLRLRGGGGCLTDCLAAIGCCCVCEECCC
ncbi:Bifunctional purine biosynthesis protein PurH [Mucor velutinosus]|uniref:Bifunctional purine biosynthesis protein PurH n=1 Tax=Mucor velutinosus TaxID=708070 RepID=A0AAN7I2D0_9FUNG|nr:Bifunctional purine biosynthesis protein PurH [Mucor velutinosus]